jgi:hypothetical protein
MHLHDTLMFCATACLNDSMQVPNSRQKEYGKKIKLSCCDNEMSQRLMWW